MIPCCPTRSLPFLYQRYNHPRLSPLFIIISKIQSPKTLSSFYIKDIITQDSLLFLYQRSIQSPKTLSSFYIKDTIAQDSLLFLYQRHNRPRLSPLFISKIQSPKTLSSFYIKDKITQNCLLFYIKDTITQDCTSPNLFSTKTDNIQTWSTLKTLYSGTSPNNHLIQEGSPLLRAVLSRTSHIIPYIYNVSLKQPPLN